MEDRFLIVCLPRMQQRMEPITAVGIIVASSAMLYMLIALPQSPLSSQSLRAQVASSQCTGEDCGSAVSSEQAESSSASETSSESPVEQPPPTDTTILAALTQRYNESFQGDVLFAYRGLSGRAAAAGIGHRQRPLKSADISIVGIPEGATVSSFLYLNTIGVGDPNFSALTLNGVRLLPQLIGRGPDTCWDNTGADVQNRVYRADVSGIVRKDGVFKLEGFPSGTSVTEPGGDTNGALLMVIYRLAKARTVHFVMHDGLIARDRALDVTQTLSFPPISTEMRDARLTVAVGDGQSHGNSVSLGTVTLSSDAFRGTEDFMDVFTSGNIIDLLPPGSYAAPITVKTPNDCASVMLEALVVSDALPPPLPSVATLPRGSSSSRATSSVLPGVPIGASSSSVSDDLTIGKNGAWLKCCSNQKELYVGTPDQPFFLQRYAQCVQEGGFGTGITLPIDQYWAELYENDVQTCSRGGFSQASASSAASSEKFPTLQPGNHFVCDHFITSKSPYVCSALDRTEDVDELRAGNASVFFGPSWSWGSCAEACDRVQTEITCCLPAGCQISTVAACGAMKAMQFPGDSAGRAACEEVKGNGGC